jgi:hypothetical protein
MHENKICKCMGKFSRKFSLGNFHEYENKFRINFRENAKIKNEKFQPYLELCILGSTATLNTVINWKTKKIMQD